MTKEELLSRTNALIQEWRIILRLGHWDIRAMIMHPSETADRLACIVYNTCNSAATIKVADPDTLEVPELWIDQYDLEKVIVHELIHLMLAGMEDVWNHVMEELSPGARNIANKQWVLFSEQPVEQLANILVSLKGGDEDQKV